MLTIKNWIALLLLAPLSAWARTPEETIAAYFATIKAGDKPKFEELLTGEFAQQKDALYGGLHGLAEKGEIKYELQESVSTGPAAHEVKIQLSFVATDGKQKFSQPVSLQLEQADGQWRIAKQGTARNSADAAPTDTLGRKPHDYVETYFAASAAQDFAAIKAMCDEACFKEALRFPQGNGTPEEQTERWFRRRMWRAEDRKFVHEECGLNKETGVYTVMLQLTLADEFLAAVKASGDMPLPKKPRAALKFKIVDGRWKLVSLG